MNFKLLQIFYDASQKSKLVYSPYFNPRPMREGNYKRRYIFMESDVLLRCYEVNYHASFDYFGVLSPNFAAKIDGAKMWGQLKNHGPYWNKEKFEQYAAANQHRQIIGFCNHKPHPVFGVAEKYHPGITKITKSVLNQIGFHVDLTETNMQPIYFNYFLAQAPVFEHFCQVLLQPFIEVAKDREDFWGKANYPKDFPLKNIYGINHWPFHPFVAERLISLYIHKEKIKVATP